MFLSDCLSLEVRKVLCRREMSFPVTVSGRELCTCP